MKFSRYAAIILAGLCLSGCKPTEKNYRAAYDAARQKKEKKAAADADIYIPATGLQSLSGDKRVEVNGATANLKRIYLKYIGDGDAPGRHKYNVAVSRYKMPTNVKAHVSRLSSDYPDAYPAQGSDGYYYVIADTFDDIEVAADFAGKFEAKNKNGIVGLDEGILIIEN